LTAYSVFGRQYIGDAQPADESAPQLQPTSVSEPQLGPSSSGEPADLPLPGETTDVQWTYSEAKTSNTCDAMIDATVVQYQPAPPMLFTIGRGGGAYGVSLAYIS